MHPYAKNFFEIFWTDKPAYTKDYSTLEMIYSTRVSKLITIQHDIAKQGLEHIRTWERTELSVDLSRDRPDGSKATLVNKFSKREMCESYRSNDASTYYSPFYVVASHTDAGT